MNERDQADQCEDWGIEAQAAAELHIGAVWDYLHAMEDEDVDRDGEDPGDDPASAPFCGCTTCEVREILHAGAPFIIAGTADELARRHEDFLDQLCETLHDHYESIAIEAGASITRLSWANTPESTKVAMREAVKSLLAQLASLDAGTIAWMLRSI